MKERKNYKRWHWAKNLSEQKRIRGNGRRKSKTGGCLESRSSIYSTIGYICILKHKQSPSIFFPFFFFSLFLYHKKSYRNREFCMLHSTFNFSTYKFKVVPYFCATRGAIRKWVVLTTSMIDRSFVDLATCVPRAVIVILYTITVKKRCEKIHANLVVAIDGHSSVVCDVDPLTWKWEIWTFSTILCYKFECLLFTWCLWALLPKMCPKVWIRKGWRRWIMVTSCYEVDCDPFKKPETKILPQR